MMILYCVLYVIAIFGNIHGRLSPMFEQGNGGEKRTCSDYENVGCFSNIILTPKGCGNNSDFVYDTMTPVVWSSSPINIRRQTEVILVKSDCDEISELSEGSEEMTLTNTGYVLKINGTSTTAIQTVWSGLLNNTYKFEAIYIYWSKNMNKNAASSIEDQITPIFVRSVYYNIKYASFKEALGYRDGLRILEYGIRVEADIDNPDFQKFYDNLQQVLEAGKSITAPNGKDLTDWLKLNSNTLLSSHKYTYQGSFSSMEKSYYCATNIAAGRGYSPVISENQFKLFTQLKNFGGEIYESKLQHAPKADRAIYVQL